MKNIVIIILAFQLFSCSSDLENEVNKLVENKNKWILSATNRNYTYTQQYKRCCNTNNIEILIKVQNGKVISASLKNGKKRNLKYIKTMQQHFEYILEVMKKGPKEKIELKVEYNETFGNPSLISVNKKNIMNGNSTIIISNVKIQ